jgi:cytochrome c
LTIVKEKFGAETQFDAHARRTIMKSVVVSGTVLLALAALVTTAEAGDAAKGQKVFNKCKSCHEVATEKNKVGPHLRGLFGRTAGSLAGFPYSEPLKASGIVWSEDTLKSYLADPKAVVPGGKMAFAGLKKEEELDDIIEYLEEATK